MQLRNELMNDVFSVLTRSILSETCPRNWRRRSWRCGRRPRRNWDSPSTGAHEYPEMEIMDES